MWLLDDLKDRRGYSHLKEEALYRTVWRHRFGGCFGPVVRQNTEWMKKLLDELKDRRGYSHLKEEALDRTVWRQRFGGGFGPVVRLNNEWMDTRITFTIAAFPLLKIQCTWLLSSLHRPHKWLQLFIQSRNTTHVCRNKIFFSTSTPECVLRNSSYRYTLIFLSDNSGLATGCNTPTHWSWNYKFWRGKPSQAQA